MPWSNKVHPFEPGLLSANTSMTVEELKTALDNLFESGAWEIPDTAIVGVAMNKINSLRERVDELTKRLDRLTGGGAQSHN